MSQTDQLKKIENKRKILITSALPYANGHIHLGHLFEYLMTDIWVRFQKLNKQDCTYICADDTHGTAITLRAQKEQKSEEQIIHEMQIAHLKDFSGFQIEFDHYGSTNSNYNREQAEYIWKKLRADNLIKEKEVEQLFDPEKQMFLADRFVNGNCPNCNAPNQDGDNCSVCGATYSPTDLINPVSTISGAKPILKNSKHLFIELEKMREFLLQWINSGSIQEETRKSCFLNQKDALRDWDVSRPGPYFGFEIPDFSGNYWYVWYDAPIGYISSTLEYCEKNKLNFDSFWRSEDCEIYHVIGKDITYFHTLFWPAMLKTAGYNLPKKIQIHGFLKVNGAKMSKSDGTFIMASTYLKYLDPVYLRYYYASKLTSKIDDFDLSFTEFKNKVNADLVNKLVNLLSRTIKFTNSLNDIYPFDIDEGLFNKFASYKQEIINSYEEFEFNKVTKICMSLSDLANEFVTRLEPWKLAKTDSQKAILVGTICLNLFFQLIVYLSPIVPSLKKKTEDLFSVEITSFDLVDVPLTRIKMGEFMHFIKRIEDQNINSIIQETINGYVKKEGITTT